MKKSCAYFSQTPPPPRLLSSQCDVNRVADEKKNEGKQSGKGLSKCTTRCGYSGLSQWNFFFFLLFSLSIDAFSHVNKCPLFICTRFVDVLSLCLHIRPSKHFTYILQYDGNN